MPAGIITTASHPKFLWPGIKEIHGRMYNEHAKQWTDLVDSDVSDQNFEDDVQVTGFGLVPVKSQGSGTAYDSEVQGFTTRYVHLTYSLGYIVTLEELEDNKYEKVSRTRASALAFSFNQTKEVVVAGLYNNAFDSAHKMGDGVSLLNTAHPNPDGSTWSNMLSTAADFNEASLESLLIQMMNATDPRGNKINIPPKSLIVHTALWFDANRVLKSVFQPDSGSNNLNVLKATNSIPEGIHPNTYLTNPNSWFARATIPMRTGLKLYQRIPLSFTQDNDFDTDNAKAKSRERYSVGATDPRALWGSNGP